MEAKALTKFTRYSTKKVLPVLDLIRRKSVIEAFKILKFVPKSATLLVTKTLQSAVANAKRLKNQEGLVIKECWVTPGESIKRFRAAAFGRAAMYKHRTCHLTIIVSD